MSDQQPASIKLDRKAAAKRHYESDRPKNVTCRSLKAEFDAVAGETFIDYLAETKEVNDKESCND